MSAGNRSKSANASFNVGDHQEVSAKLFWMTIILLGWWIFHELSNFPSEYFHANIFNECFQIKYLFFPDNCLIWSFPRPFSSRKDLNVNDSISSKINAITNK